MPKREGLSDIRILMTVWNFGLEGLEQQYGVVASAARRDRAGDDATDQIGEKHVIVKDPHPVPVNRFGRKYRLDVVTQIITCVGKFFTKPGHAPARYPQHPRPKVDRQETDWRKCQRVAKERRQKRSDDIALHYKGNKCSDEKVQAIKRGEGGEHTGPNAA